MHPWSCAQHAVQCTAVHELLSTLHLPDPVVVLLCSRFSGVNGFGEGTIQTQGDDTGVDDPTFTNRAIIGGTGVFTGVAGYVTRGGNPATTNPGPYTFVLTKWSKDSDYGSYYDGKGY